jgi:hypothetical protein
MTLNLSPADLAAIHKYSSRHRERVLTSAQCGCFYCQALFAPSEIVDWVDWTEGAPEGEELDMGKTALCPRCGIDAVLPSEIPGVVLNPALLAAMHKHWF